MEEREKRSKTKEIGGGKQTSLIAGEKIEIQVLRSSQGFEYLALFKRIEISCFNYI